MVDEGFQCTMSGIDSGVLRRDDVEGWQSAYEDLNNGDLRSAWAKVGRPYVETHSPSLYKSMPWRRFLTFPHPDGSFA